MPSEVVRGKSLEAIISEWASNWDCSPEEIKIEVLDEPGFLSKQWRVRVSYEEKRLPLDPEQMTATAIWENDKYIIKFGTEVKRVEPFLLAGQTLLNGQVQEKPFAVCSRDLVEFVPLKERGELFWELNVINFGLAVTAKVRHRKPGRYILPSSITEITALRLEKHIEWLPIPPEGEYWDEERFEEDLGNLEVVNGILPNAWETIIEVEGTKEITVAEALLPVPPQDTRVENYVETQVFTDSEGEEKIDFFASKVNIIEEGAVLARKIPGHPGVPGKNVFGKEIPIPPFRDKDFKLKKNVMLSEDGLQVIAVCAGLPKRLEEWTYTVETLYILNTDVDLETGSIEFSGDVVINGNVQDGLHVHAQGKIDISGSVSKAEIIAENGLTIYRNVLASKIVVGEHYVKRSDLLNNLVNVYEALNPCLDQAEILVNSEQGQGLKPGQCLKLLLEKKYNDLPKQATELEKFVTENQMDMITQELIVAVRTLKHFLVGLGPLDPQSVPFLKRASRVIAHYIDNISVEVPEKLLCKISYIQGATVDCGGDFECSKGSYNSNIRVNGNLKMEGVCRGGTVIAGGDMVFREIGGSGVSITTVQMSGHKRLKVSYCHPNVVIIVDKQVIRIEEACKNLEVYRERGIVQVEKLRVHY